MLIGAEMPEAFASPATLRLDVELVSSQTYDICNHSLVIFVGMYF